MKITIESTSKIISLRLNGVDFPARIWEGRTDSGIAVHAYITRIAASVDADLGQFDRELQQQKVPGVEITAIPSRLIL